MGFWDRVKAEVKSQNTTQDWVAKKAGVSFNTLRGWITKNRLPDAEESVSIANSLNTTVEFLVSGTDSTDPWLREHRQIIEDLKVLTSESLAEKEAMIHAAAEIRRRELGKDSISG